MLSATGTLLSFRCEFTLNLFQGTIQRSIILLSIVRRET